MPRRNPLDESWARRFSKDFAFCTSHFNFFNFPDSEKTIAEAISRACSLDRFLGFSGERLSLVNGIDIFHGPTNETEVTVFFRCRLPGDFSGTIRGPFCGSARTLPTTYPLREPDDNTDGSLYSARILDPCFWTPSLPAHYRAEMQVRSPDGSVEEFSSQLGIRRFAPFRRSLVLNGRRIVVRGVHRESAATDRLDDWHAHSSCFVADNPSDAVCRQASELGVMTLARLDHAVADVAAELRRLSEHAAVAIAIVGPEAAEMAAVAPNMLMAAIHDPASPSPPPAWRTPWSARRLLCSWLRRRNLARSVFRFLPNADFMRQRTWKTHVADVMSCKAIWHRASTWPGILSKWQCSRNNLRFVYQRYPHRAADASCDRKALKKSKCEVQNEEWARQRFGIRTFAIV